MGVIYTPGQILERGDLDIFLNDANGNPTNVFQITYGIYFVDPGPPDTVVLIGDPARIPINPAVGEYFAALMIPINATVGDYQIRWSVQEFAGSQPVEIVQEFGVVDPNVVPVDNPLGMSPGERELVDTLRVLLRDWCVGGEETVEFMVSGELMVVRMDELFEILGGVQ